MRKVVWNLPLNATFNMWDKARQYFDMFNNTHLTFFFDDTEKIVSLEINPEVLWHS